MSDIVERLRSGVDCAEPCKMKNAANGCLCAQAADEIERLRGDLAYAEGMAECFHELIAKAKEAERLRNNRLK